MKGSDGRSHTNGWPVAHRLVRELFTSLLSLPAAAQLPSRRPPNTLVDDLLMFGPRIYSGILNTEATALILEWVVRRAPGHDTWSAVYDLVSPATPRSPRVTSSVADTPYTFSSGAI